MQLYLSSQSPSTAGTQSCSVQADQHLGPRHACNSIIPCAGIRIGICARPCPQGGLFCSLEEHWCMSQQKALWKEPLLLFSLLPSFSMQEWLWFYSEEYLFCKTVVLCGTPGWSDSGEFSLWVIWVWDSCKICLLHNCLGTSFLHYACKYIVYPCNLKISY